MVFGDALRMLSSQATHLYVDQGKYWFSMQPSVTRTAQERAQALSPDLVFQEIAERYEESTGRYHGVKAGEYVRPLLNADTVLVEPDVALRQIAKDREPIRPPIIEPPLPSPPILNPPPPDARTTRRDWATVEIAPTAIAPQPARFGREIVPHLAALPDGHVTVTKEIDARVANGIPDDVKRGLNESSQALRFKEHGFTRRRTTSGATLKRAVGTTEVEAIERPMKRLRQLAESILGRRIARIHAENRFRGSRSYTRRPGDARNARCWRNDGRFGRSRAWENVNCAVIRGSEDAMLGRRSVCRWRPQGLVVWAGLDLRALACKLGERVQGPNTSFAKAD